jgi:hypothetical protein
MTPGPPARPGRPLRLGWGRPEDGRAALEPVAPWGRAPRRLWGGGR